jgi:uncharacterized protein
VKPRQLPQTRQVPVQRVLIVLASTITTRVNKMSASYQLSNSSDGQFHFVLKAGNTETILTSELYTAKNSAENGISSVQSNCADDNRYERKDSKNGKFYFNLKAANHQIIGTSQMYTTAQSRDKGIDSVKENGACVIISDNTKAC